MDTAPPSILTKQGIHHIDPHKSLARSASAPASSSADCSSRCSQLQPHPVVASSLPIPPTASCSLATSLIKQAGGRSSRQSSDIWSQTVNNTDRSIRYRRQHGARAKERWICVVTGDCDE
ncbi:hypothetical protein CF336_g5961 [Tilletia laevis]|uniref:Uncharacterized protein n=1 Tax=Tilletia caries TaxID=13290 RepID=A0A8T8SZI2_9BASI|nr:hypothetical protein CF336_g5961 [Tilletia laevis]KAE8203841.1 hypothetical protein CF335_g2872 [Tilletia laevis]KAE8252035.1 hypothetical protein A4X03_0g6267 [Tilletia caries]